MKKVKKSKYRERPLKDWFEASLKIEGGRAVIVLDRPTLNGLEIAWLDAASAGGLKMVFNSQCPLIFCVDRKTGLIKYDPRECSQECRLANGEMLGKVTPPWEQKAEGNNPKSKKSQRSADR